MNQTEIENPNSKTFGKILIGVTGACAFGICAIAIPFVTPALRKHCLPYIPATESQIKNILLALQHRSGKVIDLGSGDGRIVIELANHNYESHGVELNPWLVAYSKLNALSKGVSKTTRFFNTDLWKFSLSPYNNIVIFGIEEMMPDLERKLISECGNKCNIVACRFPLPNLRPQKVIGYGIDTVIRMLSTTNRTKPFTVIIEGNIGSGKTTLLDYFRKSDNICVLPEPVDLWRNCAGHNLLEHLYEDPSKWSFMFQSYVQLTMLQQHTHPTTSSIKLLERSIFSARYCFVEKLARDGIMPPQSVAVLNEWFKHITTQFDIPVDLIVYLRTTPEVVYNRVMARNRPEEQYISLQYLQDLHELHENWLYHRTNFECPAPVLALNADLDRGSLRKEYEKCQQKMLLRL
ncbi:hypothetical protein FQR65_LT00205 [Abscondita terminalis]|nr:hypothetical protein FQR65_LT00205 [Abscondita terminalis]